MQLFIITLTLMAHKPMVPKAPTVKMVIRAVRVFLLARILKKKLLPEPNQAQAMSLSNSKFTSNRKNLAISLVGALISS